MTKELELDINNNTVFSIADKAKEVAMKLITDLAIKGIDIDNLSLSDQVLLLKKQIDATQAFKHSLQFYIDKILEGSKEVDEDEEDEEEVIEEDEEEESYESLSDQYGWFESRL